MPDMPTATGTAPATKTAPSVAMTRPSLWTGLIVGGAVIWLAFARTSFSKLG